MENSFEESVDQFFSVDADDGACEETDECHRPFQDLVTESLELEDDVPQQTMHHPHHPPLTKQTQITAMDS